MKSSLIPIAAFLIIIGLVLNAHTDEDESATKDSCPEICIQSRDNCELSCSQIVGGGAMAAKRRQCVRACGGELQACNVRCVNPTPMPTLKPEAYHDKPCQRGCELKKTDCYEVCTKFTGGGAMGGKRAACRRDCDESVSNCKNWCVNPTPRPTLKPSPYSGMTCPEVCKEKQFNCAQSCSIYMGGGAKSGKKVKCINECREFNNNCITDCFEPK